MRYIERLVRNKYGLRNYKRYIVLVLVYGALKLYIAVAVTHGIVALGVYVDKIGRRALACFGALYGRRAGYRVAAECAADELGEIAAVYLLNINESKHNYKRNKHNSGRNEREILFAAGRSALFP